MQLLIIILAIILVGFIVTFFDRRRQMKVLREKLTRNYGQNLIRRTRIWKKSKFTGMIVMINLTKMK